MEARGAKKKQRDQMKIFEVITGTLSRLSDSKLSDSRVKAMHNQAGTA